MPSSNQHQWRYQIRQQVAMAEVTRASMARELKNKYKQLSEVQLSKMFQMFEAECKMQKTAT